MIQLCDILNSNMSNSVNIILTFTEELKNEF